MKAVLRKYAQQINSRIKLPAFTSYLFEFISSLQIIFLILANMENYLIDDQFLLTSAYKCIGFFTKIVFVDESSSFQGEILPIWCLCVCFLSLYTVAIILLLFGALLNKQPSHRILRAIAIMVTLQGRVLFFPIQFFFMMVCRIYRNHDKLSINDGDTYFGINWVIASAIFAIINAALAFAKEHTFYQITNITNDVYSSKGNQYHRITNLYKNIILLVLFSTQNHKTYIPLNAVFHILFNLILIYIVFKKLPFYHLQTLKISIYMVSAAFSLSLLSFLQAVITNPKVLHGVGFFILFFPVLCAKFGLSRARTVFVRILKNDNSLSPEYTIHSIILVNELIENEHFLCPKDHNFYPSKHKIFGALHHEGVDIGKLIKTANIESRQSLVYRQLVKKVERCLIANPKSAILIVFLMRMYLRLHDAGRVGELIRRLETLSSTIQVESAIEDFRPEVEKIFKKEYLQVESQEELSNYFKYKILTNQLKASIVKETNKHLEFWNDIEDRKLDVKKSIDLAGSIDDIFQNIQKIYEKDSEEFRTNFQLPLLIYAVYLNNIRYLPHEGSRMLKKFERSYHHMIKSDFNIYSSTSAVVVVSLDPKKAGQIIDYSGSILNVFDMTKADLQGLSFGCFFPSQIAKTYQSRIHQYAKSPSYRLDSKYKTFGKTKDGNFFEVEAHFKLHSYLDREMTVVILFTKLSNSQPLFIVNYDGAITDFSQKLGENFRSQEPDLINFRNIQDVSNEFLSINQAFNLVYTYDDYQNGAETPTSKDQRTTLRTLIIEKDEDFRTGPRQTLDSHADFPLLSSMSRDEDALLLTPKRSSRFNIPLSAISKPKSILRDKITGGSSKKHFKHIKTELTMEKARNICEKYTIGRRITLNPLLLSKTNKQATVKFSGDVQIRPYILDGEVHKVIIINNLIKDKGEQQDQATDFNTATFKETSISSAHDLQTSFNEDIPKTGSTKKRGSVFVTFQEKPDYTPGKTISLDLESVSNPEMMDNSYKDGENSLRRPAEKTPKQAEEEDMRSRTSSIDHTYMEIKVIKTLKEVFANKSLQFSVRITLVLIVLLVAVILGVVTANFLFSRQSTNEIQIGVRIVNYATQRLLYIQKAWQWALFIYVGALNVLPFQNDFIQLLGFYLMDNVHNLAKMNNNLKDSLSDLDAESLLESAFRKDIGMYEPLGTNYLYADHLDTFTATDVLVNRYTEFNIFNNVHELAYRPEIPFMFNNTANDYMVKSNEIISETEVFLQDLINKNIKTLNIVLGLEILFLVILAFILFAIIKKILAQHRKLFKSIVKIHRENVIDRISTLKYSKALFEQDFEVTSFIQNNYDEFVRLEGDRAIINKIKSSTFAKYQDFSMKAMKEYMFKVLAVSLIFIPLLIGLFIGSLTGSISAFESFDYANSQISVLCMASYQGNMPLSSFGYAVIFGAYPTMKIYNKAPMLQIQSNFDEFGKLNNKLTNIFLKQKEVDPVLKNMLQGPMCKYLEVAAQSNCEVATKGNSVGLLGINLELLGLSVTFINSYMANPSYTNLQQTAAGYINAATPDIWTINFGYPFMVDYILANFKILADKAMKKELSYYVAICIIMIVYLFFLYFVTLKRLNRVDLMRRRVLKMIPVNIIQDNKILTHYINTAFSTEVGIFKSLM